MRNSRGSSYLLGCDVISGEDGEIVPVEETPDEEAEASAEAEGEIPQLEAELSQLVPAFAPVPPPGFVSEFSSEFSEFGPSRNYEGEVSDAYPQDGEPDASAMMDGGGGGEGEGEGEGEPPADDQGSGDGGGGGGGGGGGTPQGATPTTPEAVKQATVAFLNAFGGMSAAYTPPPPKSRTATSAAAGAVMQQYMAPTPGSSKGQPSQLILSQNLIGPDGSILQTTTPTTIRTKDRSRAWTIAPTSGGSTMTPEAAAAMARQTQQQETAATVLRQIAAIDQNAAAASAREDMTPGGTYHSRAQRGARAALDLSSIPAPTPTPPSPIVPGAVSASMQKNISQQKTRVHGDLILLPSPISGVSDQLWTKFADAMRTSSFGSVSASNALGAWELKPRRLADLDLVMNLAQMRDQRTNRMVWTGVFVPPMTAQKFLADPKAQYDAFRRSMKDYVDKLRAGTIAKPDGGRPGDMTLSGILAILHRCGPSGLKTWNENQFEETKTLFSKVNGIF